MNKILDVEARHSAVYSRVSSKAQDLRSQEPDLGRWIRAHDGAVALYSDKSTGATMERTDWQRLWGQVLLGKVERVVVWRLDRLGRTAKGLTALFEDLASRKVGLVSLREGVDLDTPAGRLMANVIASVAQYETEVRSERQTAGIAAAQAQGVKFGRPKGTGRALKVTDDDRRNVRRLKAEGASVAAIARMTRLSRDTVYSVLNGPPPGP